MKNENDIPSEVSIKRDNFIKILDKVSGLTAMWILITTLDWNVAEAKAYVEEREERYWAKK